MTTHPTLYKRDSKGKIRVWFMESNGARHRVHAGLLDGLLVASGWTDCVGKQGRTDEEQAQFEVASNYRYQLEREYHETVDTIDQPKFFKPMLAQKYDGWVGPGFAQPKLDGIRCLATNKGLFSREGKPILAAPHIHAQLTDLPDGVTLDGELYNHDLKDDFNQIVSLVRKQKPTDEDLAKSRELIRYHVYDAPSDHPFVERSFNTRKLTKHLEFIEAVPTQMITREDQYDLWHGAWLEAGFEGSMFRLNAPYEQKRSKNLLKRKEFQDSEFKCLAIEEGVGNWAGLAKRVVCELPDGRTFGAGIKGNQARAKELLNEQHNLVTVQFFQLTPDGVPRFPVVTKFHGTEGRL